MAPAASIESERSSHCGGQSAAGAREKGASATQSIDTPLTGSVRGWIRPYKTAPLASLPCIHSIFKRVR